jgi:hypothetical protein
MDDMIRHEMALHMVATILELLDYGFDGSLSLVFSRVSFVDVGKSFGRKRGIALTDGAQLVCITEF